MRTKEIITKRYVQHVRSWEMTSIAIDPRRLWHNLSLSMGAMNLRSPLAAATPTARAIRPLLGLEQARQEWVTPWRRQSAPRQSASGAMTPRIASAPDAAYQSARVELAVAWSTAESSAGVASGHSA